MKGEPMQDEVTTRLKQCEEELARGHAAFAQLEQQRANLQQKLIELQGAVKVLRELSGGDNDGNKPISAVSD